MSRQPVIALLGNPNSGKSSLFNALTGLRQRIGNFPGVTVDRKAGKIKLNSSQGATLVDLPGAYSLYPRSGDEAVAAQVLLDQKHPDHPDLVLVVADATQVRRSLLLCSQVMDLGFPVVLALNMSDRLQAEDLEIDAPKLARLLGVPVVNISAVKKTGFKALRKALANAPAPCEQPFFRLPTSMDGLLRPAMQALQTKSRYLAWLHLLQPEQFPTLPGGSELKRPADAEAMITNELAVRYDHIQEITGECVTPPKGRAASLVSKLDNLFLHPIGGYFSFILLLFLIFQAIFAWSSAPMEWIEMAFAYSGNWFSSVLPEGWFSEMLVEGLWAGLGGIVIFVPQIAILFFFVSILESSGYMSRVVFLMDRIMKPFGFSGKSVIPLVGGMACAVPSIMMARTIPNRVERMITIMVTPLMSCSARIPVYVLLISMFVPDTTILGIFNLQGIFLAGLYLLGFVMALLVAWVIKTISRYQSTSLFITELPPFRVPIWKNTLLEMYHKSKTFVVEAGKVIMVVSVLLWFLASYGPGDDMAKVRTDFEQRIEMAAGNAEQVEELQIEKGSQLLRASFAGRVGQFMEPAIRPLGFDWKIGISLLTSFAAREVFVGTMATIYSAGEESVDDEEGRYKTIREKMSQDRRPNGEPVYTAATALSLLIFYAFAMQCMSTLAIVQKETRSWRMTLIMLVYMTGLAYVGSLITYQLMA